MHLLGLAQYLAQPPNVDHAHLTTKKQHGHEHQDRPHSPKVVFSRDGTD